MAIIRVRYKPTAGPGTTTKFRLKEHLPSIVCAALSCYTEASRLDASKEDDFELFFDKADPDDICRHDLFIEVMADKLPERDERSQEIGNFIEAELRSALAPILTDDLCVAFYLPSVGAGVWRPFSVLPAGHAGAFAPHSS